MICKTEKRLQNCEDILTAFYIASHQLVIRRMSSFLLCQQTVEAETINDLKHFDDQLKLVFHC